MPSFANKVSGNAQYKAAAKSLGMKPKQVKTQEAYQRVKAYTKDSKSAQTSNTGNTLPTSPGMGAGGNRYNSATPGGSYVNSGVGIIGDLLGKFGNNETLAGLGVGSLFDIGKTQANTGLAIAYNDAFLGSLGNFQSGQENLKTANTMKLLGVEGGIARDMLAQQGEEQRAGIRETGNQTRLGYVTQGEQQRLGFQEQGAQERETLGRKGLEERKMRADARGAIRSQGARFYG
jgi:hypothetical protein